MESAKEVWDSGGGELPCRGCCTGLMESNVPGGRAVKSIMGRSRDLKAADAMD